MDVLDRGVSGWELTVARRRTVSPQHDDAGMRTKLRTLVQRARPRRGWVPSVNDIASWCFPDGTEVLALIVPHSPVSWRGAYCSMAPADRCLETLDGVALASASAEAALARQGGLREHEWQFLWVDEGIIYRTLQFGRAVVAGESMPAPVRNRQGFERWLDRAIRSNWTVTK